MGPAPRIAGPGLSGGAGVRRCTRINLVARVLCYKTCALCKTCVEELKTRFDVVLRRVSGSASSAASGASRTRTTFSPTTTAA